METSVTPAMWRHEVFNLTSLIAPSDTLVKIRFKLIDGGTPGGGNSYGWIIDNIDGILGGNTVGFPEREVNSLSLFPNPTHGLLKFSSPASLARVYSVNGMLLHEFYHVETLDLSSYAAGMYFLEINSNQRFKVVKR
jgi:hypothetical protein